jgi:hypothetical protein
VGGHTPWLQDHRGSDGYAFRRYIKAGQEILGLGPWEPVPRNGTRRTPNGTELQRVEIRRYAIAGVLYEQQARAWAELVHERQTGPWRTCPRRRG